MKIEVEWDPKEQSVQVKFKPEEFKTWGLVAMVLAEAQEQAKFHKNLQAMQSVQKAQMQAMQDQAIKQQLQHNGSGLKF